MNIYTLGAGLTVGSLGLYLYSVASNRYKHRDSLESARMPEDAMFIFQELSYREFPFLTLKALEFGLFKTYAIPSISKVLISTNEMVGSTARRYDDTDLIMREILENGV